MAERPVLASVLDHRDRQVLWRDAYARGEKLA
jgi:hypothetical protein